MKNQYRYYITMHNGSEKLIKTNNDLCEVILFKEGKPCIKAYGAPYPSHTGEELKDIPLSRFELLKKRSIPCE